MSSSLRNALDLGALLYPIGELLRHAEPVGDSQADLRAAFIREHLGTVRAIASLIEDVVDVSGQKVGRIWVEPGMILRESRGAGPQPLVAIESQIRVDKETPTGLWLHKPVPLAANYHMPEYRQADLTSWQPDEKSTTETYHELLYQLEQELETLRNVEDFDAFYDTLYALLEKYTARVAFSAGTHSDLSLFDHARTLAAVARCLEEVDAAEDRQVLLVKGDISGIQSFIYQHIRTIENPAKQLRGRSVYLGLLSDSIAHHLLRQLGLHRANLLYNGGGHFLLLAPNHADTYAVLERIERDLNIWLLRTFGGSLQLVMASHAVRASDAIHRFDEVYQKLSEALSAAKLRKSWSVLDELFLADVLPHEADQDEPAFRILGERLPKITWLIEVQAENEPVSDSDRFPLLASFPVCETYWFGADDSGLPALLCKLARPKPARVVAWHLNDTHFLGQAHMLAEVDYPLAFAFKFAGLHAPRDSRGDVLDFEKLAAMDALELPAERASEFETDYLEYPLLGVLRMDVDNLGALFAFGLRGADEGVRSYMISRVAMLSRNLHHFFAGHLNYLAERHRIYIAYSGGDDVFAVGSWINTIAFARSVREAFAEFACQNPNMTISGGSIFAKPTYPIPLTAEMAGAREDQAKQAPGKDHIDVFNRTVSWSELEKHLEMAGNILSIIEEVDEKVDDDSTDKRRKLSRTFIHRLLYYTRSCFDRQGRLDPPRFQRVNRLLHYAFARRYVTADEMEQRRLGFKTELARYLLEGTDIQERKRRFDHFDIVASYVLLKTRTSKA